MKLVLVLLTFFSAASAFAGNLHCVSNSNTSEQIVIQGPISQGTVLALNIHGRQNDQQLEFLVNSIKPFNEFVEITGVARNRLFVGGGQMEFQLILPFKEVSPSTLKTITPVFNQAPAMQEIPMSCRVQNLYQIPPNASVLATM